MIPHGQQALFDFIGQGGAADIEAQVDGGGHLVHILAAGAAGPDGAQFHLVIGNFESGELHGRTRGQGMDCPSLYAFLTVLLPLPQINPGPWHRVGGCLICPASLG